MRQSQEWKDRAGQALDAGNEELAKKALAKKAECDQQVASMAQAVQNAQATSEKLKQQVMELKRKIDDGERTATTLVARKNAASAQRKVAEAMSGVGNADKRLPTNSDEADRSARERSGNGFRSNFLVGPTDNADSTERAAAPLGSQATS